MLFSHSPVALTLRYLDLRSPSSLQGIVQASLTLLLLRASVVPIKGAGYDSVNDSLNDCVIDSPFYLLKGPGPFRRIYSRKHEAPCGNELCSLRLSKNVFENLFEQTVSRGPRRWSGCS